MDHPRSTGPCSAASIDRRNDRVWGIVGGSPRPGGIRIARDRGRLRRDSPQSSIMGMERGMRIDAGSIEMPGIRFVDTGHPPFLSPPVGRALAPPSEPFLMMQSSRHDPFGVESPALTRYAHAGRPALGATLRAADGVGLTSHGIDVPATLLGPPILHAQMRIPISTTIVSSAHHDPQGADRSKTGLAMMIPVQGSSINRTGFQGMP